MEFQVGLKTESSYSEIMILSNGQKQTVFPTPMFCLLTSLAVYNKCTLKQGDWKFSLIQATLPEDHLTIVKPPIGFPFSGSCTYWKLRKSLYGL
jgi:hypothetical protein